MEKGMDGPWRTPRTEWPEPPTGKPWLLSRMSNSSLAKVAIRLIVLSVLVGSIMASAPSNADAGHTIGAPQGNCWRYGDPTTCRLTWSQNQWLFIRLIDQFSGQAAGWRPAADSAQTEWNMAAGPQVLQWVPATGDSWVYLNYSWTGQHGLGPNTLAMTWNCDVTRYCSNANGAMIIWWTDIYFNRDRMQRPFAEQVNVFAHEIGHSLGLFHHVDQNRLMHPTVSVIQGPRDPGDIGRSPPCSIANEWGIRCVYNWTGN